MSSKRLNDLKADLNPGDNLYQLIGEYGETHVFAVHARTLEEAVARLVMVFTTRSELAQCPEFKADSVFHVIRDDEDATVTRGDDFSIFIYDGGEVDAVEAIDHEVTRDFFTIVRNGRRDRDCIWSLKTGEHVTSTDLYLRQHGRANRS